MAATTKLIVYNAALREISGQKLVDLVTVNTSLSTLNDAWDHAIEYCLALRDWNFARRRATLTGTADTSFPPYTYRYTKPSDYLRKCWVKTAAADAHQIPHAEIAAVFYGLQLAVLLEYMSDHADNYDPANWPPHFTRVVTLQLASLVAPKIARAGAGDAGMLDGKLNQAISEAQDAEIVFLLNETVPASRDAVFRRAIEFIGQQLAGSVSVHSQVDKIRWAMNRAWPHTVRYVLELAAWNFASKRVLFSGGAAADTLVPSEGGGIIEGYSSGSASGTSSTTPVTEYTYGYTLPDDFRHKIWCKSDPNHDLECKHQFIGSYLFTNEDPCVMEYVAENSATTDPDNWSGNFMEVVAAYLALTVSPEIVIQEGGKGLKIAANDVRQKLEGVFMAKLSDAKLRDAIQQYPMTIPMGRFARARAGGTRSLIGRVN